MDDELEADACIALEASGEITTSSLDGEGTGDAGGGVEKCVC